MQRSILAGALSLALFITLATPAHAFFSTSFGHINSTDAGEVLGASSLTESQIQAILSLLSSFGAEASVINNVNNSLRGTSTTPTTPGPSPTGTGTLTVTTDASSPAYRLVAAGSTNVKAISLKFRPSGETMTLQKIGFKLTSGNPGSITQVRFYRGYDQYQSALLATGIFGVSTNATTVVIPGEGVMNKDTDSVITALVDVANIGQGQSGVSGDLIKLDVDPSTTYATGGTSGSTIFASGSSAAAGLRLFKSYPTVALDAPPSTGISDGRLMRFKVTADSHGSVGLGGFHFGVTPSGLNVSNISLFGFEDSNYSSPIAGQGAGGQIGGGLPWTTATTLSYSPIPLQVPAGGTRYFELRATVAGATSGSSITTTLLGSSSFQSLTQRSFVLGSFVWSPNSTTTAQLKDNDWTNGYGLPGLPSNGLTFTRGNVTIPPTQTSITVLSPNGGESYASNALFSAKIRVSGQYPAGTDVCVNLTNQSTQTNNVPFYGNTGREHCVNIEGSQSGREVVISGQLGSHLSAGAYKMIAFTTFALNASKPELYAQDYSDGSFSIGQPTTGSITVTAPNGGEQWEIGVMNTITWTPYQYNPDVNPAKDVTAYLELPSSSCSTYGCYSVVGKIMPSGKASIHWEGEIDQYGKYPAPGNYYVRVVNNVTGQWDRSNASFKILPRSADIKVNGSDGPLTLDTNQPVTLTWSATNVDRCEIQNAYPDLSRTTQIGSVPLSGSRTAYLYLWGPTLYCYTKDGSARYDSVQVNAAPSTASIQVTSPNGGEQFDPNQQMIVNAISSGLKTFSVALYKNDTWKAWLIKDAQTSTTSSWPITYSFVPSAVLSSLGAGDNAGAIWKIYITGQKSDGSGYVDDKSDAPFSFVAPTLTPSVDLKAAGADSWSGLASIGPGTSVYMNWTSSGVTSCTGTNFSTGGSLTGSTNVAPTQTTTYTITCTGTNGQTVSDSVSIVVAAPTASVPTCTLGASPASTLPYPQGTATISWSSTNATAGTLSYPGTSFAIGTSGYMSSAFLPQKTTVYTATFTGSGGSTSCSATLTVQNVAPSAPTISGPSSMLNSSAGQNWATYTMTSTDANGDQIRYGWDVNKDGTVDYWTPASGYVASGISQNVGYLAPVSTTGPVTFQFLAQDANGANSPWTQFTVTLSNASSGTGGGGGGGGVLQ